MTPETQNVEWKRSWRDEHLKWICGFANAQGGVLEIGKNDDGEVVGVAGALGLLEEIPGKARSLLGIVVDVNLKSEADREWIEIVVDPHPNPTSYRGRFHYRSGGTKQVLAGSALSRLLLSRYGKTWDDVALPGFGPKDLDAGAVKRFREAAAASGRLPPDASDESLETLIDNLRLRDGALLTRAAALLFHPSPRRFLPDAYVKIGYFRGSELLYQDLIEGGIFSQVERTLDLLYTKYTRGLISYDGIHRVETAPVPPEAMREAVVNAVVHRDYACPNSIQIRVYDDRISIWNPARLTSEWTAERLAEEFSSRPQNPRIAYAFFRAGAIEAWGRGIRRIIDACREEGSPKPTWRLDTHGSGLRVRFPFSEAYRAADLAIRGEDLETATQKTTADRILDCFRTAPESTQRAVAERLGLTPDGVKYHIRRLKAAGRLRRVGSGPMGRWQVVLEPATQKTTGKTTGKTTQKTTADRILDCFRTAPESTQRAVAERLGLTPDGVKYHIRRLKAAGRLRRVGSGPTGHWEVVEE